MGSITSAKKVSWRDYEALPEGAPYQLVGGELIKEPSPTISHQQIIRNVAVLLHQYIRQRGMGEVIFAPMDVCLTENDFYQPDILFVSNERKNIIQERIKGMPDLVIEVLSPSNADLDLVQKKRIYEVTGVKEYCIINPMDMTIDVFENVGNTFHCVVKARQAETVASRILAGFIVSFDQFITT